MTLAQFSCTRFFRFIAALLVVATAFYGMPIGALAAQPTADAGSDRSLEKNMPAGRDVPLDGTGSADPDGDPLNYQWYGPFGIADGPRPTVVIPEGSSAISLVTSDGEQTASDTVIVEIVPCFSIQARPKSGKVQVTWALKAGTQRYEVYRAGESDPSRFVRLGDQSGTIATYLDSPVANEASYLYVVGAFDGANRCYSNVVSAHPTAARGLFNYDPLIYSLAVTSGSTALSYQYDVNATDPNGDVLTFILEDGPAGMDIDPATGLITWTPGQAGEFPVAVRVEDGKDGSDEQGFTVTVQDVDPGNRKPTANAGPDQTVLVGETVTLDGTGSSDPDGDPLTYAWILSQVPSGSTASLSDPTGPTPFFTADRPGPYVARLVVRDGQFSSTADEVTITTANSAPVARAGANQSQPVGTTITLDGSASSDVDGDKLTYRWTFLERPAGSNATFSDATAVKPTFTIDRAGRYEIHLIVNDGTADSAPDAVSVVTLNSPPVADSGPDQRVFVGDPVQLTGAGSSDVDGDRLTFRWSFSSRPAGSGASLSDPAAVNPTFTVDRAGTYVVQLIVNDGTVDSVPDTVSIRTDNTGPVADAGPGQTVFVGDTVTLDGTGSTDVDGDDLTYAWSLTSRPTGSTAVLSDPAAALPTFTADKAGTYIAQLIVNDGLASSAPDTVTISTRNSKPVANAGPDQAARVGATVQLDGSGSSDADDDVLAFQWAITGAPAGSTATISDPSVPDPTFSPDRPGTYLIQLIVNDGTEASDPDSLLVEVDDALVAVPDVVGQTQASAESAITGAGLAVGTVTTQSSGTVPAGSVISQDPAAGAQVAPGSAVNLVVSTGPALVAVPNVVGQTQASAESAVTGAGLAVGTVTTQSSGTVPAGSVISQDPAAGAQVAPGSAVNLVVSTGPAGVVGDSIRPAVTLTANPATTTVNQTITLTVTATDDTGVVGRQLTVNGTPLVIGAGGTATFSSATPGVFIAVATADDAAGNRGQATAELRFLAGGDTTPPTVAITAPAENAVLNQPADITGTATDNVAIARYVLEYAVRGTTEFVTFATGTSPVSGGVLGQIDPTQLRNGLYEIRLTAEDTNGNSRSVSRILQMDGEAKVGNFSIAFDDVDVPVAGIPITVSRSYDSRVKTRGDFGIGWSLEVKNVTITENATLGQGWQQTFSGGFPFGTYRLLPTRPHFVTVNFGDGRTDRFDMVINPSSSVLFPFNLLTGTTASFAPAGGTRSQLAALANTSLVVNGGTSGPVELVNDIADLTPFDPSRYRVTDLDGTVYVINQTSGLEQITDSNGNTVTFGSGGVIHSAGKSITFTRDAQGRITRITDPNGNELRYAYDVYGDLVSFTDGEGNVTRFTYNSSHGLVDVIDPRGLRPARNEYDAEGRLVATIDANGNRLEVTNDVDNRQEIVRDRNGNVTITSYDPNGNVTSETDALGNTRSFTYDAGGNQLTETNALGNTTRRSFDANNNELTKSDPLGNTTTNTYSGADITSVRDPNGNTRSFGYDPSGNMTQSVDAAGGVFNFTFDVRGNMISRTEPGGRTTSFVYDAFGNKTRETNPAGEVTDFVYDANGNITRETRTRTLPGGGTVPVVLNRVFDGNNRIIEETNAEGGVKRTEYNRIGKRSAEIDELGRRTEYEYDARGDLTLTRFPDGTTETKAYDREGNLISETDRAGRTTTFAYDALNRRTRTTYADGAFATIEYDAAGQVIREVDENGNETLRAYDAAGREVRTTDALGNITELGYDPASNLTSRRDARGNTTTYTYDGVNRLVRTTFANGSDIEVGFDGAGRIQTETDQAGNVTTYGYDGANRRTSVTDPLGNTTTFTYDQLGNKLTQTDALGRVTRWEYDSLGRMTRRTLAEGMSESFTYDAVGNMLSHTDFNGVTVSFTYDAVNRVTVKSLPGGQSVAYAYTPTGQLATVTDSRGVTRHTYDDRDRLTRVENPDGTVLGYTYDAKGNRTAVTSPAGTTTYTYDDLNRLATVTDPAAGVTTYDYDAVGNRASVTYPNGTVAEYTYDGLNRLTRVVNRRSGGTVISSYDYTLAPAGNRTRVTENTGRTVDYAYDAVYRLTEEAIVDPVAGNETIAYTYDAVGNRLTKTDGSGVTAYTYDDNDRLLTEGTTTYAYDDNGNTLSRQVGAVVTTYGYDAENRLTAAQEPGRTLAYAYDPTGIRVRATVNGTVTHYVVDKNRDFAQVLEERTGGGALTVSYVYGDDLISQSRTGGVVRYHHYDGLGSTRALTSDSETVTDTYTYEAFGGLLQSLGSTPNLYLFTGEQQDPNLGFYYLRSRYYNPEIGRFQTADAHPGFDFDPPSLHKYTYVENDPVNSLDPDGKFISFSFAFSLNRSIVSALSAVRIAFSISRALGGAAIRQLGIVVENAVGQILTRIPGAVVQRQIALVGQGGPRVLDFLVRVGNRVAAIEVKYGLPRAVGPAMTRLVNQIATYASSSQLPAGTQIVLFTARAPSAAQMTLLTQQLGANASLVQHVSGLWGLVQWARFFFLLP
jgi:RHS repeat-associated protein